MELDPRRCGLALLVLVVIALPIAGCGGGSGTAASSQSGASTSGSPAKPGGSGTSSSGAPLSKSQLVAQADAICKRINAEIASVKAKSKSTPEILRIVPRNLALEQKAVSELSTLNPPVSLVHDWRQILGYRRTLVNQLAELVRDAKRHDASAVKALVSSKTRVHELLRQAATHSGFKDCARVG